MKERYLHSVRILMDCPPEERERLLSRLSSAVTAYLEDAPEAGEADLISNFGTPEECAARLLEECAPTVLAAQRKKKSRSHRRLVTALAVLLAIALGLALYLWSNGGLVIIELSDGLPEGMELGKVVYCYDD